MSAGKFRVAVAQFTAGAEPDVNMAAIAELARRAKAAGAEFLLTPENTEFMERDDAAKLARAQAEDGHRALNQARELAAETGLWILIGSLAVRLPGEKRVANRSYLIRPNGEITARYDKIHLFDVDLPGRESYRESASVAPGERAVVADTPWGRLGLSVCYDLRFPQLYRALAKAGAQYLAVPAAFTATTGQAHWHVLLRARAIETGCYVFAPAQTGVHPGARRTYGHALIVSPWGEILADAGDAPGLIMAEIDPARVAEARLAIPALTHDRPFIAAAPASFR
ncbi:MAG: carbon-nitrogen hydrolase family protein [Alphaproteobacteria bacterium]|nr:carbon-nitrogen hydrolase family protein [Alphaproteobacteria bacterium]